MNNFYIGVFWSLMTCMVSVLNDCFFKIISQHLSSNGLLTLFLRFLMSFVVLIPFLLCKKNRKNLTTKKMPVHFLRGGLFAIAMIPWAHALVDLPLSLITTISFSTPLFVVLLAKIFLKESLGLHRSLATFLGFIGILICAMPSFQACDYRVFIALGATCIFASLDIMNKKLLNIEEGKFNMMFYSSFWSTLCALPLGIYFWQTPSLAQWGILLLLGLGANGILFCLLKAFEAYDISALQPLRYAELIMSSLLGYLLFQHTPSVSIFFGACIILSATMYLSYWERLKKNTSTLKTEQKM